MSKTVCVPLVSGAVQAGFSSAADEHIESYLDLNKRLCKNPSATFYVRVSGDSMKGAGIQSGDILVVDRSLLPSHGKIAVVLLDGEFLVKRLSIAGKLIKLQAANLRYPEISINTDESDFRVWGIVTYVIHQCE